MKLNLQLFGGRGASAGGRSGSAGGGKAIERSSSGFAVGTYKNDTANNMNYARMAAVRVNPGDPVSFKTKDGQKISGTVERRTDTTVFVEESRAFGDIVAVSIADISETTLKKRK